MVERFFHWLDYKWGYVVGVPVKNPLLSDVPSLLYPWCSFTIDQIWNPFYFGGMPLLANFQSVVFSYRIGLGISFFSLILLVCFSGLVLARRRECW